MRDHCIDINRGKLREALVAWQYEAERIAMLAQDANEPNALLTVSRGIFGNADGQRMFAAIIEVLDLTSMADQIDVSVPIF